MFCGNILQFLAGSYYQYVNMAQRGAALRKVMGGDEADGFVNAAQAFKIRLQGVYSRRMARYG